MPSMIIREASIDVSLKRLLSMPFCNVKRTGAFIGEFISVGLFINVTRICVLFGCGGGGNGGGGGCGCGGEEGVAVGGGGGKGEGG